MSKKIRGKKRRYFQREDGKYVKNIFGNNIPKENYWWEMYKKGLANKKGRVLGVPIKEVTSNKIRRFSRKLIHFHRHNHKVVALFYFRPEILHQLHIMGNGNPIKTISERLGNQFLVFILATLDQKDERVEFWYHASQLKMLEKKIYGDAIFTMQHIAQMQV